MKRESAYCETIITVPPQSICIPEAVRKSLCILGLADIKAPTTQVSVESSNSRTHSVYFDSNESSTFGSPAINRQMPAKPSAMPA